MMMEFMVLFLSTLMAVEGGLVTKAEVLPLEQVQSGHAAHPRRDAARANFLQFPLYGDRVSQGYYMTKLWLGTPPREYKVLIDTGSDITWLSCKTNLTGQLQLTRFDPDNSSTAEIISCKHPACHTVLPSDGVCQDSRNPCQYLINYEDKTSTNGFYVVDSFPLMMNDKRNGRIDSTAKFIFGCSTFRSLTNDADGILGLGIQGASMVIQLYAQGKVPRVFSHCLSGKMHGGGFLIFGEVELPDISYSHYDPSRLHYSLSLESISVGGKTLPINPGLFAQSSYRGTIVDSGTKNGILVAEAFDRLLSFISKNISPSVVYTFDNFGYPCFTNDSLSFRDLFPLIHFNFVDGESMALHPTEYLLEEGYSPGFTCIGFGRSEDFTILGDLFLKDKIIIYDLERQMIGWLIYDCSVVPEVGFYPPSGPKSKAFISADLIPTLPHRMVAAVFLHLMFIYS
uniref:Peptidase A1 domain-containing protein n=1 Tax=Kalanchoe fedtschenkoi TaxID=63787 RepID=A0A7N0V558_KALFE